MSQRRQLIVCQPSVVTAGSALEFGEIRRKLFVVESVRLPFDGAVLELLTETVADGEFVTGWETPSAGLEP
ncbi:hypothetical protein [Rhodococcus sp. C3V]|uniref:hypothetical protein n=1 Tax=Rhodococcus sp. C3V TaxID=3034165 RepID=UPI0023E19A4F|nr:hypothetical protein [Rhodococcus sp. C3V]MDF3319857.1 hypothetical protein [Rhodococcus sp. C3V]